MLPLMDDDLAEFVFEVEVQCSLAIMAFNDLSKHYGDYSNDEQKGYDHIALHAFGVISHAGNLSKLFLSPRITSKNATDAARATARCNQLRDVLDIDDTSLLAGRKTRNYLEHYDERLEDWIHTPNRKPRADMHIEGRLMFADNDGQWIEGTKPRTADVTYHRSYDYSTHSIWVADERYDLSAAIIEIAALKQRAIQWLIAHGKLYED